jgi:hypothetical protein
MQMTAPSRFQLAPVATTPSPHCYFKRYHLQQVRSVSTIITCIPIGITLVYITTTMHTSHTGATNRVWSSESPRCRRLNTYEGHTKMQMSKSLKEKLTNGMKGMGSWLVGGLHGKVSLQHKVLALLSFGIGSQEKWCIGCQRCKRQSTLPTHAHGSSGLVL